MFKHFSLLTVVILAATPLFAQQTDDLIISEYVEGSSNNKYLEVYNGTGDAVDLGDYELHLFFNGDDDSTTIDLSEVSDLADLETLVLGHTSADLYDSPDIEHGNVKFNGNDAVALFKISSGTYIDVFGCIGQDPGDAWTAGGDLTTKDMTLRRKTTVTSGAIIDDNKSDFNTLENQWTATAKDDVSGLGLHPGTVTYAMGPGETSNIHVFPDASHNQLIVESPRKPQEIRIHNFAGKLIMTRDTGNTRRMNISGLQPGIYIVTLRLEDGTSKSVKFWKK